MEYNTGGGCLVTLATLPSGLWSLVLTDGEGEQLETGAPRWDSPESALTYWVGLRAEDDSCQYVNPAERVAFHELSDAVAAAYRLALDLEARVPAAMARLDR
jgi:hypothetical protein